MPHSNRFEIICNVLINMNFYIYNQINQHRVCSDYFADNYINKLQL